MLSAYSHATAVQFSYNVGAIAAESVCPDLSKPVLNRITRTNTNHGFLFCHIALHATDNTAARTCDHAKCGPPGLSEKKETNGQGERSQLLPHGSPPPTPQAPPPTCQYTSETHLRGIQRKKHGILLQKQQECLVEIFLLLGLFYSFT